MSLRIKLRKKKSSDEELLIDLRNVAQILQSNTVTTQEYNTYGTYHSTTLYRRFGSWETSLLKAGLELSRSKLNIPTESLLKEILDVWQKIGKQPTYESMNKFGKFSAGTYDNRFGSWNDSLLAFEKYINNDEIQELNRLKAKKSTSSHETKRSINLRLRYKVLKRDDFKCVYCGDSPANKSGVELEIDHIIPWSKGGETVLSNLQTLCKKCNIGKSNL